MGGGWRDDRCHLVPPGSHPVLALFAPPPRSHPSLGEQVSLGTSSQSTSSPYSPLARALCSNAPRRFHHPPPAATATLGLRTEAHSQTLLRLRVTRLREGCRDGRPGCLPAARSVFLGASCLPARRWQRLGLRVTAASHCRKEGRRWEWTFQGQNLSELLFIVPLHLSGPQKTVTLSVLVFDGGKKLATHTHDFNSRNFLGHFLRKVVDSGYNDGSSSSTTSLV